MPSEAVLWLVAGILLVGVELFTGTFVLVMLGGGALAAAGAAFLGASTPLAAVIFAVVSVGLLAGVRPALSSRLQPALEHSGHNPVGSTGLVVSRVDRDTGQIKIEGELWSARSMEHDRVFEPGERVTVMQLSGVTAVVSAEI